MIKGVNAAVSMYSISKVKVASFSHAEMNFPSRKMENETKQQRRRKQRRLFKA